MNKVYITENPKYVEHRKRLVNRISLSHTISPRIIEALMKTPRHLFVPNAQVALAYEDIPLPIGQDYSYDRNKRKFI